MIDLHLHTTCSDGRDSPETVVERAISVGLEAISVTDHDTMQGARRAARAAAVAGFSLVVIPGVELSAAEGRSAIHVLGYGVEAESPDFASVLDSIREERHERAMGIVVRLHAMNVPLSMAAVEYVADGAPITRAHIAEALVVNGHVESYAHAFVRYLSNDAPAFIPQGRLSPAEAIAHIHEADGIAVLAHPALTRRDELVAGMVRAGLDGIEIIHPTHTPAAVRFYESLARKYRIIVTGGSDAHGSGRGGDLIGSMTAPTWMLDRLYRRLAQRRGTGIGKALETALPAVP